MYLTLLFRVAPFLAAAFFAAAPAPLFANCTTPTGLKGEFLYNDDFETMQFCDGTNWISMSASGTSIELDPQVDTLTASKWCKANAGGTAIDCVSTTVDATPGGSTMQLQYNNAGVLGGTAALIYATSGSLLTITAQAATDKTLILKGAASQSVNLFEAQSSSATALVTISSAGNISTSGTLSATGDFAINTNKFNVTAASGNTAIAGTLGVTGDVAVNANKFTVTATSGNTAVGGTLGVTGDVAVNTNKFTVTAASGNTAVAGTLGVTGDVAVNTNKFTVAATSGNTGIAGTLGVTGAVTGASFSGVGTALTALDGSNISTGTVAVARLGSGSPSSSTFLRGDGAWTATSTIIVTPAGSNGSVQFNNSGVFGGGSSLVWDSTNSRLGIGTATPAYSLEVSGKAKTSAMLLSLATGNAPEGTGSTAAWNIAGDDVYFEGGKVGIGTATPSVTLDVVGSFTLSGIASIGGTLNSVGNFSVATNKFNVTAASGNTTVAGTLGVTGAVTGSSTAAWSSTNTATAFIPSGSTVPTNGLYLPASNKISLATNSTAALTIDSSQNVGIGTASPGYLLDVNGNVHFAGSSASYDTLFNYSTNKDIYLRAGTGAGKIVIGDQNTGTVELTGPGNKIISGSVGIGTASPSTALHVVGTVTATQFVGGGAGLTGITAAPAGSSGQVQFNSGSSTLAADSALTWDNTNKRLGIGTASPAGKFAVNTGADNGIVLGQHASASQFNVLSLNGSLTDAGFNGFAAGSNADSGLYIQAAGASVPKIVFRTSGNNARMTIDSSGNVGVGTTSPGAQLETSSSALALYAQSSRTNGNAGSVLASSTSFAEEVFTVKSNTAQGSSWNAISVYSSANGSADREFFVRGDGQVNADGSFNGGGADYAEYVKPTPGTKPQDYPKGSLICLNIDAADTYGLCSVILDQYLVGIVSTEPGVVGNSPALNDDETPREKDHILLSMIGRVPAKVSLEGGAIHVGDRIAQSSKPGYGMKAPGNARTVGIALQNFEGKGAADTITVYLQPEQGIGGLVAKVADHDEAIKELRVANDNQATRIQHLEDEIAALKGAIKEKGVTR